ncbi:Dam family site-specific DNA-(adenine-N6)-methyltransferase [Curtobacterium sp. RHCJP20]|uniref:Site-specific DNA-methyltransferase (adenine-specific) n=1 Tax=Curtobacterium subtropicum TaxID=3055138 RepID=A0ABT7TFZ8_9MICO|nr:Dam family site-specific DNA-(adenine-N6)-methyltransferase [Curtobacterium subtropicum]MDM7888518.1 Dam family site-specific DNA-(adenine-N6)-methyltransferase [Curtobacterium subtropicum]
MTMVGDESTVTEPSIVDGVKPVLRWAGGKRWLVPRLEPLLAQADFARYFEPFVGGGAVFFGAIAGVPSLLSDANEDLIRTYQSIKDDPDEVFAHYSVLENEATRYYEVRSREPFDAAESAARFLYLNHHSYNGIYRVNLSGKYNVPFGSRAAPNMPTLAHLREASARLASAQLTAGGYQSQVAAAGAGDLLFVDPPYVTAESSQGFTKYTKDKFDFENQRELAELTLGAARRGAQIILTNAAHPSISALFRPLGYMYRLSRRNSIGGRKATRGSADEYLFTNIRVKGGIS